MKEYKIILEDHLSAVYEDIASVFNMQTEVILQEALFKMADIICRWPGETATEDKKK